MKKRTITRQAISRMAKTLINKPDLTECYVQWTAALCGKSASKKLQKTVKRLSAIC